jgi:hypothetical protein
MLERAESRRLVEVVNAHWVSRLAETHGMMGYLEATNLLVAFQEGPADPPGAELAFPAFEDPGSAPCSAVLLYASGRSPCSI